MLRNTAFDLPRALLLAGLDILACNQREEPDQLLLSLVQLEAVD